MNNLNTLITQYLDHCKIQKNLDNKTIKAYRIDLEQFLQFLKMIDCTAIDKYSIQKYIASLRDKYSSKTNKRKVASIKAFFHYLEYEEILDLNPFSKIDTKFREPKILPRVIPFHTLQAFLNTLYCQKKYAKSKYEQKSILRDIAVSELLFATGARISELCSIKPEDIDLENGSILIHGKGKKERMIQLVNPDVIQVITEYKREYHDEIKSCSYFFVNRLNQRLSEQSVRLMINKYTEMAAIQQHITPHMFRHTFATLLLEEGVDIRYIQKILGHSSINTTEIYTHVSSAKQRDILTYKHPRNKVDLNKG